MSALVRSVLLSVVLLAILATAAHAEGATWRLEQPLPPRSATGQQSPIPIGLGAVGDIEFWAPNRGVLITRGNPPTVPPGTSRLRVTVSAAHTDEQVDGLVAALGALGLAGGGDGADTGTGAGAGQATAGVTPGGRGGAVVAP